MPLNFTGTILSGHHWHHSDTYTIDYPMCVVRFHGYCTINIGGTGQYVTGTADAPPAVLMLVVLVITP